MFRRYLGQNNFSRVSIIDFIYPTKLLFTGELSTNFSNLNCKFTFQHWCFEKVFKQSGITQSEIIPLLSVIYCWRNPLESLSIWSLNSLTYFRTVVIIKKGPPKSKNKEIDTDTAGKLSFFGILILTEPTTAKLSTITVLFLPILGSDRNRNSTPITSKQVEFSPIRDPNWVFSECLTLRMPDLSCNFLNFKKVRN